MELRHYKFYDEETKKYTYGRVLGEIELFEIYDSNGNIQRLIEVSPEEFAKNTLVKKLGKKD